MLSAFLPGDNKIRTIGEGPGLRSDANPPIIDYTNLRTAGN